jgi:glycosyltransferase involved in cell wall biosynthesis
MPSPSVSAIVPVHNGEKLLGAALESILDQDYPSLEVLVVDDASTDGSAQLAEALPGVRVLRRERQGGVAAARNQGIESSTGELLAFLDQDDRWLPGKLSAQVDRLLDHPDAGFCLAWQRIRLAPGTPCPSWLSPQLLECPHLGYFPGTLVAWRETFRRVGHYGEQTPPAESADWFARAKDAGIHPTVVEEVLLEKQIHAANQSHAIDRVRSGVLRALKDSIDRQRAARRDES